jgi:acyl-CoA thioester hydrolase
MTSPLHADAPLEHVLEPDPVLQPPRTAREGDPPLVPHPRPFGVRLTPGRLGVSRAVPHVNNVEYVRWLDRAAELHADALGFTRQSMLAIERMWFVARHEVDYRAEAFPGDRLHLFTWVRTMGRSTSWRQTVVLRADSGVPVCVAATCWAWVDLATRRPARIPPDVAASFDALEAPPCTSRS